MILLLALLPASQGAQLGDPVERAAALHLTRAGLAHVGDAVEALVPPTLSLEHLTGEFECAPEDPTPLTYDLAATDLVLTVDDVALVPADGRLELALYATLSSSPTTLAVQGDCSVLADLDEVCTLEIPTTAVEFTMDVELAPTDDGIDVTVTEPELVISPINNPITGCTLESAVGTMLGQDPAILSNLILSLVEPSLADLGPTLEATLEDALDQLAVETTLNLAGVSLDLALVPTLVEVSERGVLLGYSADIDLEHPSDCVDWQAGLDHMDADWPAFGETVPDSALAYDAGLVISRDLVDQLLFTVWASGLLCMDVSDLAGAQLNAGLLGSFLGEDYAALFPEDAPARVRLDPVLPPVARFDDDRPPLALEIEDLGLHVITPLDGRDLRVAQVDLDADIGIDVDLTSEALVTDLIIDDGSLRFEEVYSDFLRPGYAGGLAALAENLLGSLLPDDLLPTVALPYLLGIELGGVWWVPSTDGAWQGAYVVLDVSSVEPVEVPGCDATSLGCDGEGGGVDFDLGEALGCEDGGSGGCGEEEGSSCSTAVVPVGRLSLLGLTLLGAAIRRRRR